MKKILTTTVLSILSVAIIFLATGYNAEASSHYPASCTLSKTKSSDVLVVFNNATQGYGLISTEQTSTWSDILYQNVNIPTGKYSVTLQSFDGYAGRSSVTQSNEQFWVLLASNNGTKAIAYTGVSGDIPDYQEQAYWTGNVGNINVTESVDMISLRHVNPYPNYEPNSHIPVCMLLTDITPPPVNGQCNSNINGKYLTSKPSSGLCVKGTASAVSGNGTTSNPWKWSCSGINGGTTANCSALKKLTPINGECNSTLNGKVLTEKPTTNLCTKGTASAITGDGSSTNPWIWTCNGIEGGTNATCNATKETQQSNPSIQIIKDDNDNHDDTQTIQENGTATFSIKVTNNGNVDLTDVVVTDQLSPNCNKTIGNLAIGASVSYTCTIESVGNSFTNTAVVIGKGGMLSVTDTDDSKVVVTTTPINGECNSILNGKVLTEKPTINLCTKGTASAVTGDGSSTNPWTWTCNGIEGGSDATCNATKETQQVNPSIEIIKDDNGNHDDLQVVSVGGTAIFSIVVTNNGDERLNNVVISDELAPNCSKSSNDTLELIKTKYGSNHNYLDPNESFSYTCTDTNVQDDYINVAVVNGTSESGSNVNDDDDSKVIAEDNPCTPEIRITKDDNDNHDDTQTIQENGTATFSILVENRGNVRLTNITTSDELAPNCSKNSSEIESLIEAKYGSNHNYLDPWESFSYTCTDENVEESYTNIIITTGQYSSGTGTVTNSNNSNVVVTTTPINGECNSTLNGKVLTEKPTTNLCTKGTASAITGDGSSTNPWIWTCNGIEGGTNATCNATKETQQSNPSIQIIKDDNDNHDDTQTIQENGTATFSIKVTNNGNVDLTDVVVTDQLSPNCNKTIGNLAIGASVSYTCTIESVGNSFTNTAVVIGKGGIANVNDEDQSDVVVIDAPNPKIEIIKDDNDVNNHDDTQTVNYGETATFNIYVKNTGNVRLTDISVSDNTVADCSLTTSEAAEIINAKYNHTYLEPGESFHYECTDSSVTQGYTNTAITEGTGEGQTVNDTDTSDVIVDCNSKTTNVNIIKESTNGGDTQTIDEGDDAEFKITVKNTGTARLNEVYVNDVKVSDCNISTSEAAELINQKYGHTYLEPNESFSYTCTDENVEESYTNVAIVTAKSNNSTDQDSDSTEIDVDNDNVCNGSIGDFVWNDLDKDGVQDSNEEGISGVKLKLYNGNDVEKDYTGGQGYYNFDNLCEGEYDVIVAIETLPDGCYQTYDRDGNLDHSTTVSIDSGEDYSKADFGYYCPTTSVVTTGTTSPTTGAGAVAGGAATVFASGAAWLAQRRTAVKATGETLIKFTK